MKETIEIPINTFLFHHLEKHLDIWFQVPLLTVAWVSIYLEIHCNFFFIHDTQ